VQDSQQAGISGASLDQSKIGGARGATTPHTLPPSATQVKAGHGERERERETPLHLWGYCGGDRKDKSDSLAAAHAAVSGAGGLQALRKGYSEIEKIELRCAFYACVLNVTRTPPSSPVHVFPAPLWMKVTPPDIGGTHNCPEERAMG